jgi:histidine ammonia-lyase
MKQFVITNQWVDLKTIDKLIESNCEIILSDEVKTTIQACRNYLDQKMTVHDSLIYGINTGFGALCNTEIQADQLGQLQYNLVVSHACGMGEEVSLEIVKRMLLLKVLGLSKGHSGVQLKTVERLLFFYNNGIYPIVYSQGSLGASGDLAPLAHLCLPLIGEGEVIVNQQRVSSREMLRQFGLEAINLKSKEGLALLNGTQFMSAYASCAVNNADQLWNNWNRIAALSLEAYDGRIEPFGEQVNAIRNQKGQIEVANIFRGLLEGSERIVQIKEHVQDPYSFRCIPQVHGATKDAIDHVALIVEREINAVTDNPTIFPDEELIVSAGNFHGQPLAISMDFLAIALAEMGSISERRVYKLISGTRNLPPFLVANSGLNSGFMIPQYACASIVSQNKQLCTPASVDTIDSSNGQEDHVSMGANAATKLYRIIQNCWSIQGIELMNAAQAFDFFPDRKTSSELTNLHSAFRKTVPFVENDTYLHPLMQISRDFVQSLKNEYGNK